MANQTCLKVGGFEAPIGGCFSAPYDNHSAYGGGRRNVTGSLWCLTSPTLKVGLKPLSLTHELTFLLVGR